jgi:hypothetical protein
MSASWMYPGVGGCWFIAATAATTATFAFRMTPRRVRIGAGDCWLVLTLVWFVVWDSV